jgi:hypothetical protein
MSHFVHSLVCCLCVVMSTAHAAPPPGHPSTDDAAKILRLPEQQAFEFQGEVLQAIDSNAYTYIQVKVLDETLWLAAPRLGLNKGQQIRFPSGTVMRNFYSRKLKTTFSSVMFVTAVDIVPENT